MSLRGKIVIASVDRRNVLALSNIFAPLKYEISTYGDLKKLRGEIQNVDPDLLVLDSDGVEWDSYELIKKVKMSALSRLPIILMTSFTPDEALVELLEDWEDSECIRKPVSHSLLLERAKRLLLVEVTTPESVFSDGQVFNPEGKLSKVPFPRILYYLKRDARTGVLVITRSKVKKVISFEKGEPRFVVSNVVQECLGKLLVAKGKLSEKECQESLRLMKEWKRRQGETLIKMGLIEPYELEEALKAQARERIQELFGWQTGEYKFLIKKFLREDLTPVDINVPQIALSGIRRYYTLEALRIFIDEWLEYVPFFNKRSFFKLDEFKLAIWNAKIVRFIDGKRTLRDLVDQRIAREIDVYHLIFAFYVLGLLIFKESKKENKKATDGIIYEIEKMEEQDAFQILNVDYDADNETVRRQFDSLILKYTSAKLKVDSEEEERVETALKVIKEAYNRIKDVAERTRYLKKLFLEEGIFTQNTAQVVTDGEIIEKGREYLSKCDYHRAATLFRNATSVFPRVGLLHSYLGYTLLLSSEREKYEKRGFLDEALKSLRKGLVLTPDEEEAHLFYGRLLNATGKHEEAKKEFQKALQLNPENIEARRELRYVGAGERRKDVVRGQKKEITVESSLPAQVRETIIHKISKSLIIACILFAIIVGVFLYSYLLGGRVDVSKYAAPEVLESGKIVGNVLEFICKDNWNPKRNKEIVRQTLIKLNDKVKKDGIYRIKLRDPSGNTLGQVITTQDRRSIVIVF